MRRAEPLRPAQLPLVHVDARARFLDRLAGTETILLCATTLWLAARIARLGSGGIWPILLGISMGLGWWNSLVTVGCSAPAAAWLLMPRTERVSRARAIAGMALGFVAGASPWILFYAFYGIGTLRANFPPAETAGALVAARRFATETVPELLGGADPFYPGRPVTGLATALRLPVLLMDVLAVALLPLTARNSQRRGQPDGVLLLFLVAASVAALFVFSGPGQTPGPTVRYVLPLYFVVAVALAVAAVALVLGVVGPGEIAVLLGGVVDASLERRNRPSPDR